MGSSIARDSVSWDQYRDSPFASLSLNSRRFYPSHETQWRGRCVDQRSEREL